MTVQDVVYEYAKALKRLYANKLKEVVLYGSYARGDYNEQSDVDVMIIVALPEEEIKKTSNKVSDIAFELLMKYALPLIKKYLVKNNVL